MTRRSFRAALSLLVLGSAVVLFAVGRVWVSGTVVDPGLPTAQVSLTGHLVAASASAFGLLGLAGAAVLALTRGRWRSLLGALLSVAEAGAVVVILGSVTDPGPAVRTAAGAGTGALTVAVSAWPYSAALGAAAAAVAGGIATLAPARRVVAETSGGTVEDPGATAAREPDLWAAIERGDDPTEHA